MMATGCLSTKFSYMYKKSNTCTFKKMFISKELPKKENVNGTFYSYHTNTHIKKTEVKHYKIKQFKMTASF